MGAVQAKDQGPVHGSGGSRREEPQPQGSGSRAAASASAAQGGAVVERPTQQQPGDRGRGRGTHGSSSAAAAAAAEAERKGKKKVSASDDREQARRKSDPPPREKLLGSSMRAHQAHAERKAFEMLIEKTKGWKRMSEYQTSRASYSRGQFLLEFFSNYDTTDDIFSFLRLVAATWMCALRVQYGRRLNLGGRPVEDWCSRAVLPPRETANWIVVRALAEAFRVAVRVEDVNSRSTQNTHYSIPRGTPIVTLLFIDGKYDIIYPINPVPQAGSQQHPHAPAAETSSGGGAGQRAQSGFWWFDCCFAVPRDIHPRAADQAKPH